MKSQSKGSEDTNTQHPNTCLRVDLEGISRLAQAFADCVTLARPCNRCSVNMRRMLMPTLGLKAGARLLDLGGPAEWDGR